MFVNVRNVSRFGMQLAIGFLKLHILPNVGPITAFFPAKGALLLLSPEIRAGYEQHLPPSCHNSFHLSLLEEREKVEARTEPTASRF